MSFFAIWMKVYQTINRFRRLSQTMVHFCNRSCKFSGLPIRVKHTISEQFEMIFSTLVWIVRGDEGPLGGVAQVVFHGVPVVKVDVLV